MSFGSSDPGWDSLIDQLVDPSDAEFILRVFGFWRREFHIVSGDWQSPVAGENPLPQSDYWLA